MIYKSVIGQRILKFHSPDSTNAEAQRLLSDDRLFEGDVVIADFQTSGKGLDKNTWESEISKNILLSFLFNPIMLNPDQQFVLNKIVSLAVLDFVKEMLPRKKVKIKWPNDVYVDDKKIAGILINNSIYGSTMQSSIIGIGLNVNQTKFISNAPNPISLRKLKRKELDLNRCMIRLLDKLNLRFRELAQNQIERLDEDYLSNLYRYKFFSYYKINGEIHEAQIVGLDQYGKLCLKTKDLITYCCDLKEVKFVI